MSNTAADVISGNVATKHNGVILMREIGSMRETGAKFATPPNWPTEPFLA